MNTITLRAHFDGEQICLDEPFELKPNTRLIITVLLEDQPHDEHGPWLLLSQQGLETAYGENEVEYSLDLIKEPNPDYERR
jgi:hypothetical protein